MVKIDSYNDLIAKIQSYGQKLNDATISQDEMQELQTLSRKLYERIVILNYKIKEQQVYSATLVTEEQAEAPISNETIEEELQAEPKELIFDLTTEEIPNNPQEEKPSEHLGFDFTEPQTEPASSEKIKDEELPTSDLEQSEVLENREEELNKSEPKVVETAADQTIPDAVKDIASNKVVFSFYEKFTQVGDNSLISKLSSQRINSLIGAFGLNDKLQMINELFDGNADEFNEVLSVLDHQESNVAARVKLSEIAAQHQWQPDHILVEDFVKMVERRYA